MEETKTNSNISPVIIHLLRGVLYRDRYPLLWQGLLDLQAAVMDYVAVLDLECMIDEAEGYAYLRQKKHEDNNEPESENIPRLVQTRPLSYPVSLLCILLRKKLVEADAGGDDGTRVILTREQIVDMIRVFLPENNNEVKIIDQVETHINKIIEFGFLRRLKDRNDTYEIRRIIKAFVDADWISSLDEKLTTYQEHADAGE